MSELNPELSSPPDKEFLYSVLNLPTSASPYDIRERYRSLSVIFHPDKQHGDESTNDTAAKRFLEIQKAYEVLSDPFLRAVYDVFGEDGLSMSWPADLSSKPPDQIRDTLKYIKQDVLQHRLESSIRPRGGLICAIDATSLLANYSDPISTPWHERLLFKLQQVQMSSFALRHSVRKSFKNGTELIASSRVFLGRSAWARNVNVLGTVRHQYSPRWTLEGTLTVFHPRNLILRASYQDDKSAFVIQTRILSVLRPPLPPPITVSFTQRLSATSLTEGVVTIHVGPQASITVAVVSPAPFNFTSQRHIPPRAPSNVETSIAGSLSGFGLGTGFTRYAITLSGLGSNLAAEWGIKFSELAVLVKLGLELGVQGITGMLTGAWHGASGEVSVGVGASPTGVLMRLELGYLEQRVSLPITLSQENDAGLAFWTAVVPSTVFVLGYHFILKPRRRRQRTAFFRAARQALAEEKSVTLRETAETTSLLKETAKKHMQAESSKDGLVILEATYGPMDSDEEAKCLFLDVTVAVQALVHNSQLYVPGHRPKSGIQGFCDPAPSLLKSLRVRYNFRTRMHYAEIPDHSPVVLPLADHLIQDRSI